MRNDLGTFSLVFLSLPLNLGMLAESLLPIMTGHRSESVSKYRTFLNLLPVMQHETVLQRALDLLASARNNFLVVRCDGMFQGYFVGAHALKGVDEVGDVANAVIEALTAV